MIEVSVIVCVRNEEHRVQRQLDALDQQDGAPPFEIIVVDNGSTDRTRSVISHWRDGRPHRAGLLRLLDGPRRPSIPRSRNLGAAAAQGRVLAFCDADDRVRPGWVAAFAEAVSEDLLAGGRIIPQGAPEDPRSRLFDGGLVATPYLPYAVTCNLAIPRRVLDRLGGFEESLPAYGFEDVDLSWRAQRAGLEIRYVPAAVVEYTLSDARSSVRKKFLLGRGRVAMARRYPEYDPTRYTPGSTALDLARQCGNLLRHTVRDRRLDRRRVGQVVAGAGRIVGSVCDRGRP